MNAMINNAHATAGTTHPRGRRAVTHEIAIVTTATTGAPYVMSPNPKFPGPSCAQMRSLQAAVPITRMNA